MLAIWAGFYAVAALAIWLNPMGLPGGVTLFTDAATAANAFKGDVGFYQDFADSIWNTGRISSNQLAIAFPPLNPIMIGAVFHTVGRDAYLFHMLAVTLFLWATAFCFVYRALNFIRPWWARFLIINSVWLFRSFIDFGLWTGAFYAESKTMPFFIVAVAALAIAIRERKWQFWLVSTIAMSLAAYTRVYFETVGNFVFFGAFLGAAANFIFAKRKKEPKDQIAQAKVAALSAFAAFFLFSLSLVPYKHMTKEMGFGFKMCPQQQWTTFYNLWTPSEKLPGDLALLNTACLSDPELCEIFQIMERDHREVSYRIYRSTALLTLLTRAGRWYEHRRAIFWQFWAEMPNPQSMTITRARIEGSITLFLWIVGIVFWLTQLRHSDSRRIWACVFLAFSLQNFIMFSIAGGHYRHSLPVRLFVFYSIPLSLGFFRLSDRWGRLFLSRRAPQPVAV